MHFLTEKRFPWFENIRNMMFFLELDNEWYKHIDYVLNDLHFLNDYTVYAASEATMQYMRF